MYVCMHACMYVLAINLSDDRTTSLQYPLGRIRVVDGQVGKLQHPEGMAASAFLCQPAEIVAQYFIVI